ncbi:putative origin recognition complex subunit [Phaeomoniella chlamydospora]|uniref:Putative origin recognition complex subunit n=1 Tax=Phaeomoniella chlamydospora TaxID=158046 RepID=A0A0G2F2E0_PHACM|nr:putative origin recognition complex subunit [Phaeomoniella chlamydospora]
MIVVYGFEATAKSSIVEAVIEATSLRYAFINCLETISQRHLLHKTLQSCVAAIPETADLNLDQRCEHLNTLAVQLQRLLEVWQERFVLVLDARLGEMIPNLTVIMIVSSTRSLPLQRPAIPYIHFPPYTRAEAVTIVGRQPPEPPEDVISALSDPGTLLKWYTLFTTAVYDSLIAPTSRSLPLLRKTCLKLWPKFVQPIIQNEPPPTQSSQWDFSKLFVRNRALFQAEGESSIISRIEFSSYSLDETTADNLTSETQPSSPQTSANAPLPTPPTTPPTPLLKYTTTLVLLASYLCSHTSPKVDILLFSRLSNSSSKSRRVKKSYHRKKLNFSSNATPTKRGTDDNNNNNNNNNDDMDIDTPTKKTPSKNPSGSTMTTKIGKSIWSLQAKIPHPFPLDRLYSIYRAIHPQGIISFSSSSSSSSSSSTTRKYPPISDSLSSSLVELSRLRLVVPVSSSSSSTGTTGAPGIGSAAAAGGGGFGTNSTTSGDVDDKGKWRVNVQRQFVEERCREWGIGDQGVGAIGEWEI